MSHTKVSPISIEKKPYTHPYLQKIDPATVENASILEAIAALNHAADELERTNEVMRLVRNHLYCNEIDHIQEENSSSITGRHVHRIPL